MAAPSRARARSNSFPSACQRRRWSAQEDANLRAAVNDVGEKNWKLIATRVVGRNHVQCLQRWKKVLRPGLIRGRWTESEDGILRAAIAQTETAGIKVNWGDVSGSIPGRSAKQCRERWCHHLVPMAGDALLLGWGQRARLLVLMTGATAGGAARQRSAALQTALGAVPPEFPRQHHAVGGFMGDTAARCTCGGCRLLGNAFALCASCHNVCYTTCSLPGFLGTPRHNARLACCVAAAPLGSNNSLN